MWKKGQGEQDRERASEGQPDRGGHEAMTAKEQVGGAVLRCNTGHGLVPRPRLPKKALIRPRQRSAAEVREHDLEYVRTDLTSDSYTHLRAHEP